MTSITLRKALADAPAYRPGKRPDATAGKQFKLSSNESPYAPLPSVAAAATERISHSNRYPDAGGSAITAAIAQRCDVEPEQVVLGAGSVEVIGQLMRAVTEPGDEIIFPWRSFEAYPLLALGAGARSVKVSLTASLQHDFTAMRSAICDRTRLLIICNPNNPTGTIVEPGEVEEFLQSVPPSVVVLIDEAYFQFNSSVGQPNGVELFHRFPNVVVAHTFSKAYGLAGLRIGYGLAPTAIAAAMRTVAVPFGVTDIAQAAALASFAAEQELRVRVDALVKLRTELTRALELQGWRIPPTQANFFWFPLGKRTGEAVKCFERHGVLVRPFDDEGLRVSIGDDEANAALLAASAELALKLL